MSDQQSRNVSGSMGQLLLQGYTMLADSCPHCTVPLMRAPGATEAICVSCNATISLSSNGAPVNGNHHHTNSISASDDDDDDEEEVLAAPPPLRERLAQSRPAVSTQEERGVERGVDSSQEIADKMLEGWTLLAEHCPRCYTPLLRSKEQEVYCVTCRLPVRYQQDEDSNTPTTTRANGTATTTAAQQRMPMPSFLHPQPNTTTNNNTTTTNGVTNQNSTEEVDPAVVDSMLSYTLQSLAYHMTRVSSELTFQGTPGESGHLIEEIRACTAAMSELMKVKHSGSA